MGSVCSRFGAEDFEEYRNPYGSVYRHCICLRFLAQQFMHVYAIISQREEHVAPSSSSSSSSTTPSNDGSFSSTLRIPARPSSYDDPRCSQLDADGPATGHEKSEAQFDEESEPLRRAKNNGRMESTIVAAKWSGHSYGVSRKCCSESSMNHPSIEITGQLAYMLPSSEEEDVCPTCLEEYTSENPRIILQCSHHFHLGCIYEWMERSELCPVCGKVMVFNETC